MGRTAQLRTLGWGCVCGVEPQLLQVFRSSRSHTSIVSKHI